MRPSDDLRVEIPMEGGAKLSNGEEKFEVKNVDDTAADDSLEQSKPQEEQGRQEDVEKQRFMSDLSKKMHCPMDYKKKIPFLYHSDDGRLKAAPESSLSYIPWRLKIADDDVSDDKPVDGNRPSETEPSTAEATAVLKFPAWTYLDLRRRQNNSWASDRLKEGNELLFINPTKAETKFLEGLDLVPDHVDTLAAYAKLLMTNNDFSSAESKLKLALETDPDHKQAQKVQLELNRKKEGRIRMLQQQQRQKELLRNVPTRDFLTSRNIQVSNGNSIYSDVLMERALTMGDDEQDAVEKSGNHSDDSEQSRQRRSRKSRKERKRSKKKKRKRRRKKRRHRYYSSDSEDDGSSHSDSSEDAKGNNEDGGEKGKKTDDNEKVPEKKRKRTHRRERRRRYYSSESEDDHSHGSEFSNDDDSIQGNNRDAHVDSRGTDNGSKEQDKREEKASDGNDDGNSMGDKRDSRKDRKRRRHRDERKHHSRRKSRRRDSS